MAPRPAPPAPAVPEATVAAPSALDGSSTRRVLRSFHCREGYWQQMEQLSRELECSVDYLLNEAVRQYLRQRTPPPAPGPVVPSPPGAESVVLPPSPLPSPRSSPRLLPPTSLSPPPPPPPPVALGALEIEHDGHRYPVDKASFVVGRAKQGCDLVIADPFISRKHLTIEHDQGQFYAVDMGTTGGVEFKGHRISRKLLRDGDVLRLCDHELRVHIRTG
jgi:hypothetical protein